MILPHELRQLIVDFCDQDTLCQLARVDRLFHRLARPALYRCPTICTSVTAQLFLAARSQASTTAHECRNLTLRRDARSAAADCKRKGGVRRSHFTEADFVHLVESVETLERLDLEPDFTSLRRRSLSAITTRAHALQSLAIAGYAAGDTQKGYFSLDTIGRIVSASPSLKKLYLIRVRGSTSTLDELGPVPTCTLSSFSIVSSPSIRTKDLGWLLRSTCLAESLRDLTLEWNSSPRPVLEAVRYAVLRVERLTFMTRVLGSTESLVLHCPSLRRLTIKTEVPVDAVRLLMNLESDLYSLSDDSSSACDGVDLMMLALLLEGEQLRHARRLRRITIGPGKALLSSVNSMTKLRQVCATKHIAFTSRTGSEAFSNTLSVAGVQFKERLTDEFDRPS